MEGTDGTLFLLSKNDNDNETTEKITEDKRGRKSAMTSYVKVTIREALKAGNTVRTACRLARLSEPAFYSWLSKGRQGIEPYKEFLEMVELAQAECQAQLVAQWTQAAHSDWRASQAFLATRFKQDGWALQDGMEKANIQNNNFYIQLAADKESAELIKQLFRRKTQLSKEPVAEETGQVIDVVYEEE